MRTTTTIASRMTLLVGVAIVLSGCTASVNTTIAAEDVATVGAKALSDEWDTEATMDCGDDSVDSVEGTEVECVAYNPKSGLDYPATVTLTTIEGSEYTVSVVTGSPDTSGSEGTDTETDSDSTEDTEGADDTSTAPTAPADAATVTGESLAGVVAPALAEDLGYEPTIDCGTADIPIYVDAEIQCIATADDGLQHPANIVITAVTATNYELDVEMMSTVIE